MTDFDVVVVGAGAAGLWAAISAAREGARTLVVEKATAIGQRIVCAEGVDADGIRGLIDVKPDWVAWSVGAARLHSPDGSWVEVHEPGAGFVIHKGVFLQALAHAAGGMGVEMRIASEVTDVRPGGDRHLTVDILGGSRSIRVKCGAVVAADGIESSIGRKLGIVGALRPAHLFSCAQDTVAPVEVADNAVEVYFGRSVAPGGYAWVFPKGKDVANVGVGILAGGSRDRTAVEYLSRFKQARCPESKVLSSIVGGVPSERSPFRACGRGVFLAGDAARVADPVSGAGIVQGMKCGAVSGRYAFLYSRDGQKPAKVERDFVAALKSQFEGRAVRWAIRRVLARMSDSELSAMVGLIGEYRAKGVSISGEPMALLKFLAAVMPAAFKISRHLARV